MKYKPHSFLTRNQSVLPFRESATGTAFQKNGNRKYREMYEPGINNASNPIICSLYRLTDLQNHPADHPPCMFSSHKLVCDLLGTIDGGDQVSGTIRK